MCTKPEEEACQRMGVLYPVYLPYSPGTGSLTEPVARLRSQQSPASTLHMSVRNITPVWTSDFSGQLKATATCSLPRFQHGSHGLELKMLLSKVKHLPLICHTTVSSGSPELYRTVTCRNQVSSEKQSRLGLMEADSQIHI